MSGVNGVLYKEAHGQPLNAYEQRILNRYKQREQQRRAHILSQNAAANERRVNESVKAINIIARAHEARS